MHSRLARPAAARSLRRPAVAHRERNGEAVRRRPRRLWPLRSRRRREAGRAAQARARFACAGGETQARAGAAQARASGARRQDEPLPRPPAPGRPGAGSGERARRRGAENRRSGGEAHRARARVDRKRRGVVRIVGRGRRGMSGTALRRLATAAAVLLPAAGALAAEPAPWPDSLVGRLEALALIESLNADLLSHDSATLTLERWCADHRLADPARIVVERVTYVLK